VWRTYQRRAVILFVGSSDSGDGVVQTAVLAAMGFGDLCQYWTKVLSPAQAGKIASVPFDPARFSGLAFCFAQGLQALEEVKVNKQLLNPPPPNQNKLPVCHSPKKTSRGLSQESRPAACLCAGWAPAGRVRAAGSSAGRAQAAAPLPASPPGAAPGPAAVTRRAEPLPTCCSLSVSVEVDRICMYLFFAGFRLDCDLTLNY